MRRSNAPAKSLCCSFCRKAQGDVSNLIANPGDYPRAYICDECIRVCSSILEDEAVPLSPDASTIEVQEEINPLLDHPLASRFLTSVERWVRKESLGLDAAEEFGEMRNLAMRMLRASE